MEFKLNLITPTVYSESGKNNCVDELAEEFAEYVKHRADTEFKMPCKFNKISGLAYIHNFEDFEERFLIHSEYAVIIASPNSQKAIKRFLPRLLVFLSSRSIWMNRFLFVVLGDVEVMDSLVVNPPIKFSMNNWRTNDEESWTALFDLIKVKWIPYVEKSIDPGVDKGSLYVKEESKKLVNVATQGSSVIIDSYYYLSKDDQPSKSLSSREEASNTEDNQGKVIIEFSEHKEAGIMDKDHLVTEDHVPMTSGSHLTMGKSSEVDVVIEVKSKEVNITEKVDQNLKSENNDLKESIKKNVHNKEEYERKIREEENYEDVILVNDLKKVEKLNKDENMKGKDDKGETSEGNEGIELRIKGGIKENKILEADTEIESEDKIKGNITYNTKEMKEGREHDKEHVNVMVEDQDKISGKFINSTKNKDRDDEKLKSENIKQVKNYEPIMKDGKEIYSESTKEIVEDIFEVKDMEKVCKSMSFVEDNDESEGYKEDKQSEEVRKEKDKVYGDKGGVEEILKEVTPLINENESTYEGKSEVIFSHNKRLRNFEECEENKDESIDKTLEKKETTGSKCIEGDQDKDQRIEYKIEKVRNENEIFGDKSKEEYKKNISSKDNIPGVFMEQGKEDVQSMDKDLINKARNEGSLNIIKKGSKSFNEEQKNIEGYKDKEIKENIESEITSKSMNRKETTGNKGIDDDDKNKINKKQMDEAGNEGGAFGDKRKEEYKKNISSKGNIPGVFTEQGKEGVKSIDKDLINEGTLNISKEGSKSFNEEQKNKEGYKDKEIKENIENEIIGKIMNNKETTENKSIDDDTIINETFGDKSKEEYKKNMLSEDNILKVFTEQGKEGVKSMDKDLINKARNEGSLNITKEGSKSFNEEQKNIEGYKNKELKENISGININFKKSEHLNIKSSNVLEEKGKTDIILEDLNIKKDNVTREEEINENNKSFINLNFNVDKNQPNLVKKEDLKDNKEIKDLGISIEKENKEISFNIGLREEQDAHESELDSKSQGRGIYAHKRGLYESEKKDDNPKIEAEDRKSYNITYKETRDVEFRRIEEGHPTLSEGGAIKDNSIGLSLSSEVCEKKKVFAVEDVGVNNEERNILPKNDKIKTEGFYDVHLSKIDERRHRDTENKVSSMNTFDSDPQKDENNESTPPSPIWFNNIAKRAKLYSLQSLGSFEDENDSTTNVLFRGNEQLENNTDEEDDLRWYSKLYSRILSLRWYLPSSLSLRTQLLSNLEVTDEDCGPMSVRLYIIKLIHHPLGVMGMYMVATLISPFVARIIRQVSRYPWMIVAFINSFFRNVFHYQEVVAPYSMPMTSQNEEVISPSIPHPNTSKINALYIS